MQPGEYRDRISYYSWYNGRRDKARLARESDKARTNNDIDERCRCSIHSASFIIPALLYFRFRNWSRGGKQVKGRGRGTWDGEPAIKLVHSRRWIDLLVARVIRYRVCVCVWVCPVSRRLHYLQPLDRIVASREEEDWKKKRTSKGTFSYKRGKIVCGIVYAC